MLLQLILAVYSLQSLPVIADNPIHPWEINLQNQSITRYGDICM